MNRLDKWVKSQKNKPIHQKRAFSSKDESNDNYISEDKAIINVQIEFEFDSKKNKT